MVIMPKVRKKMTESTPSMLVDALLQRNRLVIVSELMKKPLHISQLAERINLDRATTAYHLGQLRDVGLVEQEYKILDQPHSKGRAGSFYKVNHEVFEKALAAMEELEVLRDMSMKHSK